MKLAIIGSRSIKRISLEEYIEKHISEDITEIVSGGAVGIDSLAREFAEQKGIKLTEFFPDYSRYGRCAPIKRNESIAKYADRVIAFWDGRSKGTLHTVNLFKSIGKKAQIILIESSTKK